MKNFMEVGIVSTEDVFFGERFRQDYGDMSGLINSFKKYGVIQPLAVAVNKDGDKPYKLLAGGRRFDACRLAEIHKIPVRIYSLDLTDLELRSIELEENIQRKDLDFIEDCNLKREIHRLQLEIHGEKVSTSPNADGWSMRDTANLLNVDHKTVSMDIKLANAVDSFPDLNWKDCKNKSDAVKMIHKLEERVIRKDLSDRANKLLGKTAKKRADAYITGNFFEMVKKVPERSIEFIELDPPYAIELPEEKGTAYSIVYGNSYNEVSRNQYIKFMKDTLNECYRVMNDNSWIIVWFAPEPWFDPIYHLITLAGKPEDVKDDDWIKSKKGLRTRRLCGIWTKPNGQTRSQDVTLGNCYEMFYYARKGNAKINIDKRGRSNEFAFSPVPPAQKIHPTERPLDLMEEILDVFAWEGSRVLVPFAGSGKTLTAAYNKKMFPIGYDLSKEYKEGYVAGIMREEFKGGNNR